MKYNRLINLEYDDPILIAGEKLIWKGKPKKGYFILSNIVLMMPIALIWIIFDGFMIGTILSNMTREVKMIAPLLGLFFAFHLTPVWLWLSEISRTYKDWKNSEYYITDQRIIVKNGLYYGKYESIYYKDVIDAKVQIGALDRTFGVGDIYIKTTYGMISFMDVRDVTEVYDKLQKTVKEEQKNMGIENIYKKKKKQ